MKTLLELEQYLKGLGAQGGQELYLRGGMPLSMRVDGEIREIRTASPVSTSDVEALVEQLLTQEERKHLEEKHQVAFAKTIASKERFRLSIFYQRGAPVIMFRRIPVDIIQFDDLGLPEKVRSSCLMRSGLILIIGLSDSGKTTTAAAILDLINRNTGRSILTVESPIEYLLQPVKSVISQRSIPEDAPNAFEALEFAREEHTDVIFLDNLHDEACAGEVLNLAGGGRLVIATMEACDIPSAITNFVGLFSEGEERQIRAALGDVLLLVLNQRLVPKIGGGRVLASSVLIISESSRTMIRDAREQQILHILETSRAQGMRTLDQALVELTSKGIVEEKAAKSFALRPT